MKVTKIRLVGMNRTIYSMCVCVWVGTYLGLGDINEFMTPFWGQKAKSVHTVSYYMLV